MRSLLSRKEEMRVEKAYVFSEEKKGMCQNTKNMKITPVTDICSKGDFVTKRVLTHPPLQY